MVNNNGGLSFIASTAATHTVAISGGGTLTQAGNRHPTTLTGCLQCYGRPMSLMAGLGWSWVMARPELRI